MDPQQNAPPSGPLDSKQNKKTLFFKPVESGFSDPFLIFVADGGVTSQRPSVYWTIVSQVRIGPS